MKKKVISTLTAIAVCATMATPAMASSEVVAVPEGTDVYAGVTVDNEAEDPQIRVTVPTTFAFVANGSLTANTALSSSDGTILLPNVKVTVDDHSKNDGSYSVDVEGESNMYFRNYSTYKNGADSRAGAPIDLTGYIEDEGQEADRNYWNHVASTVGDTEADFKNYQISVDGKAFTEEKGNRDYMADSVTLAAPTGTIDATTKLANAPSETTLAFDVKVGGKRNMYRQVEESAKVGTITWVASYNYANTDGSIETSPSKPAAQDPMEP